jgi:CheY-like chemotaxis protein
LSQSQQEQDFTVLKPSSSQKKRILVVDDEVDITTIFKLGLERVDFQVDVYNDPSLALSDYKPGKYELLLLDIKMPKMNGLELYKGIKDKEYDGSGDVHDNDNDKPKVCYITTYEEYRIQFKESFPIIEEVECYPTKSITIDNLVKAVKSQLRLV